MNAIIEVLSFEALCARAERFEAERLARREWGAWRLDTRTWELLYVDQGGAVRYPLDLERVTSAAAALDWIAQVHKKTWSSAADIGNLVHALDDIFDMQARLCSFGATGAAEKKINATEHLIARYGAPDNMSEGQHG